MARPRDSAARAAESLLPEEQAPRKTVAVRILVGVCAAAICASVVGSILIALRIG